MGALWLIVITFICGTIQSMVGFGYNILFMAVVPFFIPYGETYLLCLFGALLSCGVNLLPRLKMVRLKQIIVPLTTYFIFAWVTMYVTASVDVSVMRRFLGAALAALSVYFIFFSSKLRIKGNLRNGIIAGALSGIGGGAFAINGPPIGVYFLSALKNKDEYMATTQAYFFIAGIYTIIIKLLTADASVLTLCHSVLVLLSTAAGVIVGIKIFDKLNDNMVKMGVYIFMGLSGLWILIGG